MADRDGIRRVARFLGLPGPASRWSDDFAEPAGVSAETEELLQPLEPNQRGHR